MRCAVYVCKVITPILWWSIVSVSYYPFHEGASALASRLLLIVGIPVVGIGAGSLAAKTSSPRWGLAFACVSVALLATPFHQWQLGAIVFPELYPVGIRHVPVIEQTIRYAAYWIPFILCMGTGFAVASWKNKIRERAD